MKKEPQAIEKLLSFKIVIAVFIFFPLILVMIAPFTSGITEEILHVTSNIIGFNFFLSMAFISIYGLWRTWKFYKKKNKILIIGFTIFALFSSIKYTTYSILDGIYYIQNGADIVVGEVTFSLDGTSSPYYLIEINNDKEHPLHAHAGPNLLVGNTYRIYYLPHSRSIVRTEFIPFINHE